MINKSKMMLPILAVIVGVATSAFTDIRANIGRDNPTWTYMGTSTQSQAQLNDPDNYDFGGTTCSGSTKVCTIEAPSDGGSPQRPILNQGDVSLSNLAYSPTAKN